MLLPNETNQQDFMVSSSQSATVPNKLRCNDILLRYRYNVGK